MAAPTLPKKLALAAQHVKTANYAWNGQMLM